MTYPVHKVCCVILALCTGIISVGANYTLEILMLSYENPSHMATSLETFRHGCCERDPATPCDHCDNAFRVCVRERATREIEGGCDLLRMESTVIEEDNDDLMFTFGEDVGGLSNPILVSGELWHGTVEVVFSVFDLDMTATIGSASDMVDNVFIYPVVSAVPMTNGPFSDPETFTGNASLSHLGLAFRLTCGPDHFGPACTFCVETDNSTGHYSCDYSTGEKVCLESYQRPETDCQECAPATDCSAEGGYCIEPGECLCRTGNNCSEQLTTIPNSPSLSDISVYSTEDVRTTTFPSSTPRSSQKTNGLSGLVAIIVSAILIMLSSMILIFCYAVKKRKKTDRSPAHGKEHSVEAVVKNVTNHAKAKLQSQLSTSRIAKELQQDLISKNMLFQKHHVELGKIVGQGESGLVYCGYIYRGFGKELVAIKTGKALPSAADKERLIKEVSIMLSFQHPNVMSLNGLCFDEEVPLLVMPFMLKGTVLKYVKENRELLYFINEKLDKSEKVKAARNTCFGICLQIAKGMSYITSYKFVHRDLAARNCMISMDGVIKVADFGLMEDMYATNYYRRGGGGEREAGGEEKVPIRWMAPESIEADFYNEKTDVWSFGVTCWEVMMCGAVPYAGVHVMSLLRELGSGHRLDRPSNVVCSDEMLTHWWNMMMACWSSCPQERPEFASLVEKLPKLLESDFSYVNIKA